MRVKSASLEAGSRETWTTSPTGMERGDCAERGVESMGGILRM